MAFFSRIADILKANINDMIDKAEDPEKMVKQLIVEIEQDVEEATQALGQAMGSQKMAAKELADAMAKSADWNDKAKLALKAGNEELARRALECKVGVDAQIEAMQKSYDQITAQVNKMKDQVTDLRMKLDEAPPPTPTPPTSTPPSPSSTASSARSPRRSPSPRPSPRLVAPRSTPRSSLPSWRTMPPSTPSSSASRPSWACNLLAPSRGSGLRRTRPVLLRPLMENHVLLR